MSYHNQNLTQLIKQLHAQADIATCSEDLVAIIQRAIDFKAPIVYRSRIQWLVILGGFVAMIATLAYPGLSHSADRTPNGTLLFILFIFFIGGIISLIKRWFRQRRITKLNNKLYHLDLMLDNGLHPHPVSHTLAAHQLNHFEEFRRGNFKREFIEEYTSNKDAPFPFSTYTFKYVDRHERMVEDKETYKGSDGVEKIRIKKRKEVTYSDYFRCGAVFYFPYASSLWIIDDGHVPHAIDYNTSSIAFSERFKLGATDTLKMVKFLKPRVVEVINQTSAHFRGFNIEINDRQIMCVGFKDLDLLSSPHKRRYGIDQPQKFLEELKQRNVMPKLQALMYLYSELTKHSDNNFSD